MTNYELLKEKIQRDLPTAKEWSFGNQIKLIKGENSGDIYTIGYDCWLKRNGALVELPDGYDYYLTDFVLIGKDLMLNDVLLWHTKSTERSKYSHFEVHLGEGYFSIYDGEETESKVWDLSKLYLKDQSPDIIEWLLSLV
jgi:hypothetical protein